MELNFSEDILKILLKDMTSGKNILWATNDYRNLGEQYFADKEIKIEQLNIIEPRFKKIREKQKLRTRDRAEIFTPTWICNEQNNLIDADWFDNAENNNWQAYVESNRLEITCGEAPYLVSRYDATSGDPIPIDDRIGLLDRKLRVISKNVGDVEQWLTWAVKAVQSIYGYEFQGDNLFIARNNILMSVKEYFQHKFSFEPSQGFLKTTAEIISWNLWQMDGLTNTIPYSTTDLFSDDNYCRIKDWRENKTLKFIEVFKERK